MSQDPATFFPNAASAAFAAGPDVVTIAPSEPRGEFRPSIIAAFGSLFRDDQWILTLVIGGACVFAQGVIPVVPLMLYVGYLAYWLEWQIRHPDQPSLEFDTDRVGSYLTRGVWPVLAQIVLTLLLLTPVMMLSGALMVAIILGGATLMQQDELTGTLLLIVGIGLGGLLTLLVFTVTNAFLSLLYLRSCLSSSFREAFRFGWAWQFLRACWGPLLLGILAWTFLSLGLVVVGSLLFCVGAYAAQAWSMLALVQYLGQCYQLFLVRGGTPVTVPVSESADGLGPIVQASSVLQPPSKQAD